MGLQEETKAWSDIEQAITTLQDAGWPEDNVSDEIEEIVESVYHPKPHVGGGPKPGRK